MAEPLPQALTDFVFDLYDSVARSQIAEEQSKLYNTDFPALAEKYGSSWPEASAVASECNGDPLFLAIYRELTSRHLQRPSLRDRMDGWQIYKDLLDEVLESPNFFLTPTWVFDILNEFVYQFQGFCQMRSTAYAAALKAGLIDESGKRTGSTSTNTQILGNLEALEANRDVWAVEDVYMYLSKLNQRGWPKEDGTLAAPVFTYFSIFGCVVTSRLECLLGDYTASVQALKPISTYSSFAVNGELVPSILNSVVGARISMAYHVSVSFLLLDRYKDAINALLPIMSIRSESIKQLDRMLGILAVLHRLCPTQLDEVVLRSMREKYGKDAPIEQSFQCPKFICTDPLQPNVVQGQVQIFLSNVEPRTVLSYLSLYKEMEVKKLAHLCGTSDVLSLVWATKWQMRQKESPGDLWATPSFKSALDINFHIAENKIYMDEAVKTTRFTQYFVSQIEYDLTVRKEIANIDTRV